MLSMKRRRARARWSRPLVTVGSALAVVLLGATAAHAEPIVNVEYDASGTTHIASTDSTIELGPTVLSSSVDLATGEMTGSMALPGTRTSFEVAGFIPVTADVAFEEAAPTVGSVTAHPEGGGSYVEATASYHLRLSNIKVAGFPTFPGPFCRTIEPVTIHVTTPDGERFDLFTGGRLTGEYAIGDFQNCGLNTWLINLLIPGAGNTVEFQVSDGRATG